MSAGIFPAASVNAHQVDNAFIAVLTISGIIFLLLLVLVIAFCIRYRQGSRAARGPLPKLLQREVEIGWTAATTFLAVFIFAWYVGRIGLPARADPRQLEIHVVAKQWMWKTQHPDGASEIDALHLPIDTPVRLVMTSQDAIHSFYVPEFRIKQDVLPIRSTELVITPTKLGTFHLFCAEFCGTQHSRMTGEITVMAKADYASWTATQPHGETQVSTGEALYARLECGGCHNVNVHIRAPKLAGVYGRQAELTSGKTTTVDDAYLANSILRPRENMIAGYDPIMPSYANEVTPAEVDALIAYIKSLPPDEAER